MGWLLRLALTILVVILIIEPEPAPAPTLALAPAPAPPPPPAPARPIFTAPPMLVTLPPEPGGNLGPCPASEPPRDPDVAIALERADLIGATAARRRPGWLAAWSTTAIYLSTDDGRSFAEVLPGPGVVRDVAIDCHGRVFAMRDEGLFGVRHGSRESWQVLRQFERDDAEYYDDRGPRLAADGGLVALAGARVGDINDGLLLTSVDGAATWKEHRVGVQGSWEGTVAMNIDGRGQLRMLSQWGDCMVDGTEGHRFDPATGRLHGTHAYDPYLNTAVITDAGWVYAPWCETAAAPCVWDARGQVVEAPRVPVAIRQRLHPGDHMLAQPVDHGGRVLGIEDGRLVRWSARRDPPPPPPQSE